MVKFIENVLISIIIILTPVIAFLYWLAFGYVLQGGRKTMILFIILAILYFPLGVIFALTKNYMK